MESFEWKIGNCYYEMHQVSPVEYNWLWGNDEDEVGGYITLYYPQGSNEPCVNDFDGYYDLPRAIKRFLEERGIKVDF